MDGGDRGDEGRTFRCDFSSEGVVKLRAKVTEKLKEFMGDYTDDTLVEYVIVLLKNGRRKEEAQNELNVFLGDDSDPFISWLWHHLESNLNLYIQSREVIPEVVVKAKPAVQEQAVKDDAHQLEPESEKARSNKSRTPRNREWRGLVGDSEEHPILKSSTANSNLAKEESHHKVDLAKQSLSPRAEAQRRRSHREARERDDPTKEESHRRFDPAEKSLSPRSGAQRKRSYPEEQGYRERDVVSQATSAVPRRLLQFAVRDAVAMPRPSKLTREPSMKRLRSVVSTASEDGSLEKTPQRIRSVATVTNTMETAIKAVAEAAKDVKRARPSRNVFDRLGRATGILDTPNQLTEIEEDGKVRAYSDIKEDLSTYHKKIDSRRSYSSDVSLFQGGTGMASNPGSNNEEFDDMDVTDHEVIDASQSGTALAFKGDNSVMLPHTMTSGADGRVQKAWKDQFQPTSVPDTYTKNTSVNTSIWKSPQYQEARGVIETNILKSIEENKVVAAKSSVQLMKENNDSVALGNGNVKPEADIAKDSQKMQSSTPGLFPSGLPTEDSDSRTIFVNNVHFAATKDSLSRHFNKFGEVLKVVILTEPATGLPKGSAYVEFLKKEAAVHALSLDGTSFMSRILKVVKKSCAPPEVASSLAWPRAARAFPFAVPGFSRPSFPRGGIPNVYRARLPVRPAGRSMQWKREAAQSSQSQISDPAASSNINISSGASRGLTYVRPEPKTNGSSNNAQE